MMDDSRISICSISVIEHPPEKAFEIIGAAGYKKVDILERVPHFSLFPEECEPATLKAAAQSNGLQIANLGTYVGGGTNGRGAVWTAWHGWTVPKPQQFTSFGFSSDTLAEQEKELEQLVHAIDLAVFFGARSIRVIPGTDRPDTVDKIVPWLKRAAEYAEEQTVYMGIEHMHGLGTISGTPELLRELVEKVGSPYLGVLYEPGNLMYISRVDYRHGLEVMKEYIVHCHLKDVRLVGEGYESHLPGEGDIDLVWIVEQLEAAGYEGDYALEYEVLDPGPEPGFKMAHDRFVALFE